MSSQTQEEIPYAAIASLLKAGEVVPFLGAGVNYGGRGAQETWTFGHSRFLPMGGELSRYLASQIGLPSEDDREDLARVAAYYEGKIDRGFLRLKLRDVFDKDYDLCSIHRYLAEISRSTNLLIVTTNYDDLTEKAFIEVGGQPFSIVIDLTDHHSDPSWADAILWGHFAPEKGADIEFEVYPRNTLDRVIDLSKTSVIYKMHGTVDRQQKGRDSYLITEDDYVQFLARMTEKIAVPPMFMNYFNKHRFLFLGYSLRDWNVRVILRGLLTSERPRESRSWCVQFESNPSPLEKTLWDRKGVYLYNQDIDNFVRELRKY
jgi:SIR2-like domain